MPLAGLSEVSRAVRRLAEGGTPAEPSLLLEAFPFRNVDNNSVDAIETQKEEEHACYLADVSNHCSDERGCPRAKSVRKKTTPEESADYQVQHDQSKSGTDKYQRRQQNPLQASREIEERYHRQH
jgi:hypothetical protein